MVPVVHLGRRRHEREGWCDAGRHRDSFSDVWPHQFARLGDDRVQMTALRRRRP